MYSSFSWLTGLLSAMVAIVLYTGSLSAQASISSYHLPANPSVDDTLQFVVSWGTEDDSLEAVNTFSCTLYYSGFQIDPGSLCSVLATDSSWFLRDCDYSYEVSIDTAQHRIDILVVLDDDSLRSGYGHCLLLGGPVVIVDDESFKRSLLADPSPIKWLCWYDRTGRRLGSDRPQASGLFIREGFDPQGKQVRKLIFIH